MTPLTHLLTAADELDKMDTALKCMTDCQKQIDLAPMQKGYTTYEIGQVLAEYRDLYDSSMVDYEAARRAQNKAMLAAAMLSRPDYVYNEQDTAITPRNYAVSMVASAGDGAIIIEHPIDHSGGATC